MCVAFISAKLSMVDKLSVVAMLDAGAQEPAAAALLRLRVLREVLPQHPPEADVSSHLCCSSSPPLEVVAKLLSGRTSLDGPGRQEEHLT